MTTIDPPPDAAPAGSAADADRVEDLAHHFGRFAEQGVSRLPLYRRLCEAASADLEVCARLLLAPVAQQTPNLLLAAVHDLLLRGEPNALADWYPSIPGQNPSADARSRPVGRGDDDPWPHFRELALHHPVVEELLRTRSTQTNEVGRSAALFPALFQASSETGSAPIGGMRSLGLIEIGSSAGLNLHPGAYGFRYRIPPRGGQDERLITSVGPRSRLMLECELRGDIIPPLPEGALPVSSAVGIDERPLDVMQVADARWLQACQWPEELDRLTRLRAAIGFAQEDAPVVDQGDAVDDLRAHVEAVAPHALPVVVSTWVLAYLSVERQREFMTVLDDIGASRDVALVYSEQPERIPGIPVPGRPDGADDGRATALVRMEWHQGQRTAIRLADQHPHGRWLEWLAR